jgi:phage terminase small subunit
MAELFEYGPKMARLTELQRNYIKAQAAAPFANPTQWARMAGYSDHKRNAKVQAQRLKHDPKLEAAAHEYAAHMMHRDGPVLAVAVMMRIARNDRHPRQLHAAEAIADRIGLHRLSEHRVKVEHSDESAEAKVEKIKRIAALLGIPVASLLGGNVVEPKVIEHSPEENKHRPGGKGDGS